MAAQELRPYQRDGLQKILAAYKRGARRVLCVLPTAGGKTTIFTSLAAALKEPVLINVHRRELATQATNRLREFGADFGVIMARERPKPYARIQVASVQTLVRRKLPSAGLVINDEAHLSTAKTWRTILDSYERSRVLGVTATPWRLSGKPLAEAYDEVVVIASPGELREAGWLSPYVGFSYKAPDLSKVETVGEEYNVQQSSAAMREPTIVANVVEQWLAHARDLSTVVFAVTVEHSKALTAEFVAAGVRAEHLDGGTPLEQRQAILKRVESGATQVLCNVGIAVEGLDIPRLKCCVLARPTKSLARAIQMMGRVRRPWNGLTARIHDHAFVIGQHGLPDAERDYTLNAKREDPPPLTTCEVCLAVYQGRQCPSCAHENAPRVLGEREIISIADAEKIEFASESTTAVERPPVEIAWNDIGRLIEGTFLGTDQRAANWGQRNWHRVKGAKRTYDLPGTADLDRRMAKVRIGATVRVTYEGEKNIAGNKTRKEFSVEVDEPALALRAA